MSVYGGQSTFGKHVTRSCSLIGGFGFYHRTLRTAPRTRPLLLAANPYYFRDVILGAKDYGWEMNVCVIKCY